MTTQFTRFQYTSMDTVVPVEAPAETDSPASPSGTSENFVPQSFSTKAQPRVEEAAKETIHGGRFRLDARVANQLRLEETEKKRLEDQITAEIESRWILAKEKAEVAGYTAGLELGKKEAIKAEQPKIQERLDQFDKILHEIDSMREKIFQANEVFLMDIVSQVARMVTLKELEVDQDYLRRVITGLLAQLGKQDDVKILLSEADMGIIDGLRVAIEKEFGKLSNTVIETNLTIPKGGCKLETRFGVIDASAQTQIENIIKALKN
jgi:flagellar assembly protein FliH